MPAVRLESLSISFALRLSAYHLSNFQEYRSAVKRFVAGEERLKSVIEA